MNFLDVITVYYCTLEVTFIQLLHLLKRYYVYLHYMFAESI